MCSAATNRKTLIKTSLRRGFLFSDEVKIVSSVDLLAIGVIVAIMATDAADKQDAFNLNEGNFGCGKPVPATQRRASLFRDELLKRATARRPLH